MRNLKGGLHLITCLVWIFRRLLGFLAFLDSAVLSKQDGSIMILALILPDFSEFISISTLLSLILLFLFLLFISS